jgi:hypothetical protein
MKAVVRAITTSGKVRLLTEQGQSVTLEAKGKGYLKTGDIVVLSQTIKGLSVTIFDVEDVLPPTTPETISIPKEEVTND